MGSTFDSVERGDAVGTSRLSMHEARPYIRRHRLLLMASPWHEPANRHEHADQQVMAMAGKT
jgi:hypothetical protein